MPQCDTHYIMAFFKNQLKTFDIYDIIPAMTISADTILNFHHLRTSAHIQCLNYFAGLLGYHFPEHDNDKMSGPICMGYAYINYAKYHPDCKLTQPQLELYHDKHAEHHHTQPHHLEYYSDTTTIPDVILIEMVCDWHSANFEQRFVTNEDTRDYTVQRFFNESILSNPKYKWHPAQIDLINELITFLGNYADHDAIMAIWRPVMFD